MDIQDTAFPIQIQNILQVHYLFLQFYNQRIVCSTDSVGWDFDHNLLSSIGKLQGRDGLWYTISFRVASSNQSCLGIATKRVLE